MWTAIAIVCGIAALVAYYFGTRQQKPWGTPIMALMVLGAVAAVIMSLPGVGENLGGGPPEPIERAMRTIGEGLKGEMEGTPRVLVIRNPEQIEIQSVSDVDTNDPEEMLEHRRNQIKAALEKGFGGDIEIVGFEPVALSENVRPSPYPAPEFNTVIDEYRGDVDVVISTVGLPSRGGQLDCQDLALEDVAFYTDTSQKHDPGDIRACIEDGNVDGISMMPNPVESPERRLITADNLDEIPEL